MSAGDSLFNRMLSNRHSYALGGPVKEAAEHIAKIKQHAKPEEVEILPLTEADKQFLRDLKVKA